MVMTARLASTSDTSTGKSSRSAGETESPQETYQKALKLLQDPLLPVRAHGLMLLRQLVSARKSPSGTLSEPALDRALVPGILSIFMQSIQDDDSYMFLNAVQGLSAMVDGYGKDVLRGLVKTYSDGVDGLGASEMSQHEVDMRTRVGEALGQVIRRCGDALPSYGESATNPGTPYNGSLIAFHSVAVSSTTVPGRPHVSLPDCPADICDIPAGTLCQNQRPCRTSVHRGPCGGDGRPPTSGVCTRISAHCWPAFRSRLGGEEAVQRSSGCGD